MTGLRSVFRYVPENTKPPYWNLQQAASFLGVTRRRLENYMFAKNLPAAFEADKGGRVLFYIEGLKAWALDNPGSALLKSRQREVNQETGVAA
jgi:hypothetical protein